MAELTDVSNDTHTITRVQLPELGEHCYAVKVSPDGLYLAATFGNGVVRLLDARTFEPLQRNKLGNPYDDLPTTCVKWCAKTAQNEHTLVSTSAAGVVFGWVWDGQQYMERSFKLAEEKNDTAALDVSLDGKHFCTAGCDRSIRIYSFEEKKVTQVLSKGVDADGHTRTAHNNRIFSTRYVSSTALLSGGWESPVQVWDLRTGKSERQVSGSQVGADSIEPIPHTTRFIVASNRATQQLQVFDYIGCRELEDVSQRLSAACGKSPASVVRLCQPTNSLFVCLLKTHTVLHLDYETGRTLGAIECKVPVMGLDVSPLHPGKVFIACMNESILVAELKRR